MIVLVPLPLGTMIAEPPPGVVVVWYLSVPPLVTAGPLGVWYTCPAGLRPGGVVFTGGGADGGGNLANPGWVEPGGVELPRAAGGGGRFGG
jgi:hypothetical protein